MESVQVGGDGHSLGFLPTPARIALASAALRVGDLSKWAVLRSYPLFEMAASAPIPRWAEPLGARAALRAALHAYRRVPAYRDFCDRSGWTDDRGLTGTQRLLRLPITDKKSYIDVYPTPARCLDGKLPLVGTEMDESSGSSGTPYNWVRGQAELDEVHRQLSQFARWLFKDPVVAINAFSMGAWSTGMNTAQALHRNGLVKSPGPDLERIVHTMRFLGPGYVYVITGYPPFLAEVIDYGAANGIDWRAFRAYGIVGGEAMSENLRDRLLRCFVSVFSAYGASDLDIGVAAETPLTVWLRRQCAENAELKRQLFGDDPRLPMVFQYNPLDYMIETVDQELVITVSRLSMLSPRIRYNIHDAGGGHSLDNVVQVCRDFGLDPMAVEQPRGRQAFRFPLLYVHGRSDATISFMGANIYPEDVEQAIFSDAGAGDRVRGFCLELQELGGGVVRPCVHVELLRADGTTDGLGAELQRVIVARLEQNSRDFKNAVSENAAAADLLVQLHGPDKGPFAENSKRIKRRYIVRA